MQAKATPFSLSFGLYYKVAPSYGVIQMSESICIHNISNLNTRKTLWVRKGEIYVI